MRRRKKALLWGTGLMVGIGMLGNQGGRNVEASPAAAPSSSPTSTVTAPASSTPSTTDALSTSPSLTSEDTFTSEPRRKQPSNTLSERVAIKECADSGENKLLSMYPSEYVKVHSILGIRSKRQLDDGSWKIVIEADAGGRAGTVTCLVKGSDESAVAQVSTTVPKPPATTAASTSMNDAAANQSEEMVAPRTTPLDNAKASAQNYLRFQAFSRQELIDQLSSSYGEKYPLNIAIQAVDSLQTNWNEQAVRAAKEYQSTMPMSCDGMIDQLSSTYGSKFTRAQATYGAHRAGVCG